MVKLIDKKKSHAFKKDVYLLGILNGEQIWLGIPSWAYSWRYGFGYIETYTDIDPATSRDIKTRTHYDTLCPNFGHILEDLEGLEACTLTRKEQWMLSDLMKSFYALKETARLFYTGNSFDNELIPAVVNRIIKLLKPDNNNTIIGE